MMEFIESCGHVLTFTFLPYVPAYSCDPNVRPTYTPFPDHTDYIVKINDKIEIFGSLSTLGSCFSNRRVGLSANRKIFKGQDWQGFCSTAKPNLRFRNCFDYTPSVLAQRSFNFYNHVNCLMNAIP